jgi:hypothetical protein
MILWQTRWKIVTISIINQAEEEKKATQSQEESAQAEEKDKGKER